MSIKDYFRFLKVLAPSISVTYSKPHSSNLQASRLFAAFFIENLFNHIILKEKIIRSIVKSNSKW